MLRIVIITTPSSFSTLVGTAAFCPADLANPADPANPIDPANGEILFFYFALI
jgi:hypothetical protein